ncbi:hypothetical protein FQR65_LT12468 [Abscondita terminalis]|nr:hypothetical protein FQR65_LT12468 [Abscondita terminalis]
MENSKAIEGVKRIIEKLTDEDLHSLTNTVTQGFLKNKIETREDAITSILKYSPDLKSILKRKVVTRDILFSYLHENNVSVSLPTSKSDLIDLICTYWDLKTDHCKSALIKNEHSYTERNVEEQPPSTELNKLIHENTLEEISSTDVNTLALKFSEWFYTMMNSNSPMGQEHFWNDANLKLNLLSATQNVTEEIPI